MIKIVGAGLAGCEAAYQLLKRGYRVTLYEMRPVKYPPAHKTDGFAELVCSNSLKSTAEDTASGLLKAEMKTLDSLIIKAAEASRVDAGGALAVDRAKFSALTEQILRSYDGLTVVREEVTSLNTDEPYIYATGPLTSDALYKDIERKTGQCLHFFDAAAPIVDAGTIDSGKAFFASRYGKGDADYLNLPLDKDEYEAFIDNLVTAQTVKLKGFEGKEVFEGCMPVEVMAKRGKDTLRFGPLKPVGLYGPDGGRYYAVVQLRKETEKGTAYNMVGFQTNLTFAEQKRVFSMIPALKNAEFLRYGVMHRNSYLNSPSLLDATFRLKSGGFTYFAGQFTGVEGYVESAMSGLFAALHLDRQLKSLPVLLPSENTVSGALCRYISSSAAGNFQPMNANFGILPSIDVKDKKLRKKHYYIRGLNDIILFKEQLLKEEV